MPTDHIQRYPGGALSTVQCFMIEPSGQARAGLRRYSPFLSGELHYHNVEVQIGVEPYDPERAIGDRHPHADERWPMKCTCGYVFKETDEWQRTHWQLYKRAGMPDDNALLIPLAEAPIGAMWFAPWYSEAGWVGSDGQTLVVKLPDGTEWIVDGSASNAPGKIPGWTRSGIPPNFVVTPSIATPNYHGFLGGPDGKSPGVLVSCP